MATELEYACYAYSGYYLYVKAPIGSDNTIYYKSDNGLANTSADLTTTGETCTNLKESSLSFIGFTYNRYTAGDLYKTIEEESNTTALYVGSDKIKDTGEHGVYLGSQNTNCLTYTPKNINLEMVYGAWAQPVLTANGTWGGDSFATKTKNNKSGAYKAFDNSGTSYIGLNTGADNELYFYNPQPLKISKIDFTYYPSTWIIEGELYGSNDDSNYVLLATIAHSANTGSITVNNTTGYKYFKIKAISANGSDGFSKKITDFYHIAITATAQNTLVLKAGSKVYVPNGFDDVKYYKYTYSSWTQPVLTANGTLGGDSFAVTESGSYNDSNPAYRVFDSDTLTHCIFDKSSGYLMFYNPNPLKVTKLTITNAKGDTWGTRALTAGTVYGSNNGTAFNKIKDFTNSTTTGSASWSIDMSANTQGYKYYKIIVTDTSYSNSGAASQCMVSNLAITATQQTGFVESTADDYDYTVGNGQPKFDEIVIGSDVVASNYTGYTYTALACYVPELNKIILDTAYTGSGNGFEYNVQENYLRLAGNWSDTTWIGKLTALPLGLIEMTSAVGVTSIIQTFNWCGCIGSTAFVLPGVKGLIPDGLNADGTYKSIETESKTVYTYTASDTNSTRFLMLDEYTNGGYASGGLEEVDVLPITGVNWRRYYVKPENKIYFYLDGVFTQEEIVRLADIKSEQGTITSLTPYTAQPEMTAIPIKEIYNGSQLVYKYNT